MTTYAVREVLLSGTQVSATTLPGIIAANDPQNGSTLAGFLPTQDGATLYLVWALAKPVTAVAATS